jgi:hypothetical protein
MTQHTPASTRESLCLLLRHVGDRLAAPASRGRDSAAGLELIRRLIEALPLTTEEFGLAVNRLASARRYLSSGEGGAARYELRLLRRSLEQ